MQAIRQIIDVHNRSFNVLLPDDFDAKKVEIIILPLDEEKPQKGTMSKFKGIISKETAQELHQHLEQSRNEWDRNF